MTLEELLKRTSGKSPLYTSYGDIVSGIQSQYKPQTEFARSKSLLDIVGGLQPEQTQVGYGTLLQAQPASEIKQFTSSSTAPAVINSTIDSVQPTTELIKISDLTSTSPLNNDPTKYLTDVTYLPVTVSGTPITASSPTTTTDGLFGTSITGKDVATTAATVAPIAALAGNSDLVKTAIALNLIGSAADLKTEQDVLNLGTKIAMLAAGPAGNVIAAGLGLLNNNTPMTVDALLSAANPTLGLVNTISNNLTGYSVGNIVNGLLNAPEGSVEQYGLLGAVNVGNLIANQGQNATTTQSQAAIDKASLQILASLGDTDAAAQLAQDASSSSGDRGILFIDKTGGATLADSTGGKYLR